MHLDIAGVFITVHGLADADDAATSAALTAARIPHTFDEAGVRVHVQHGTQLRTLNASVVTSADMDPLWHMWCFPADEGTTVTIDTLTAPHGTLQATWTHSGVEHAATIPPAAVTGLLAGPVTVVASPPTFEVMRSLSSLPLVVGRAHVNHDWFVEVSSTVPQACESAPIPGLFRLGTPSMLGLPLPYLPLLQQLSGFIVNGHELVTAAPPEIDATDFPVPVDNEIVNQLREVTTFLATTRSVFLRWQPGAGRRFFITTAVQALDTLPALVVCPPSNVWVWYRHARLCGLSVSTQDYSADIHIVTPARLAALGSWPRAVHTIVFDDPHTYLDTPGLSAAASRLGPLSSTLRIGVSPSTVALKPQRLLEVFALLRPAEFNADIAIAERYPPPSVQRFNQHVSAYTLTSTRTPAAAASYPQTKVLSCPLQAQLVKAYAAAVENPDPLARVTAAREVVCAGSAYVTSPKIAAAAQWATQALGNGRRVVIVTAIARAARLIAATLTGYAPLQVTDTTFPDPIPEGTRVVILTYGQRFPDLSWFDDIIFVEPPASFSAADNACGFTRRQAPEHVVVLHSPDTIDDLTAITALDRKTLAACAPDPDSLP